MRPLFCDFRTEVPADVAAGFVLTASPATAKYLTEHLQESK